MKLNLNHLHLHVSNLDKSKEFYCKLLDFKEKASYGSDLVFLKNSFGFDLALNLANEIEPLPDGVHFGFSMDSKEQMEAFYQRGKELYPDNFIETPRNNGSWGSFAFMDPDNHVIEVYWDPDLK